MGPAGVARGGAHQHVRHDRNGDISRNRCFVCAEEGITSGLIPRTIPNPRQALLSCVLAAATGLACAVVLGAAALVPAPPAAVPFLVIVCIGCPLLTAWELPVAVTVLRLRGAGPKGYGPSIEGRALGELRRDLDDLPEIEHPLGY